jgi:hypothetical protein
MPKALTTAAASRGAAVRSDTTTIATASTTKNSPKTAATILWLLDPPVLFFRVSLGITGFQLGFEGFGSSLQPFVASDHMGSLECTVPSF